MAEDNKIEEEYLEFEPYVEQQLNLVSAWEEVDRLETTAEAFRECRDGMKELSYNLESLEKLSSTCQKLHEDYEQLLQKELSLQNRLTACQENLQKIEAELAEEIEEPTLKSTGAGINFTIILLIGVLIALVAQALPWSWLAASIIVLIGWSIILFRFLAQKKVYTNYCGRKAELSPKKRSLNEEQNELCQTQETNNLKLKETILNYKKQRNDYLNLIAPTYDIIEKCRNCFSDLYTGNVQSEDGRIESGVLKLFQYDACYRMFKLFIKKYQSMEERVNNSKSEKARQGMAKLSPRVDTVRQRFEKAEQILKDIDTEKACNETDSMRIEFNSLFSVVSKFEQNLPELDN
ncbi:hypothetical protein IJT10_08670 [bacterium]|nr:hypothetical protein [bacterium]